MKTETEMIKERISQLESDIEYYNEKVLAKKLELGFITKHFEDKSLNPQLR